MVCECFLTDEGAESHSALHVSALERWHLSDPRRLRQEGAVSGAVGSGLRPFARSHPAPESPSSPVW